MQIRHAILLVLPLVSGCWPTTPQTQDCPVYCDDAAGAQSIDVMNDKCVAAFGPGYSVQVRACPRGEVPAACASLTEYTNGSETILCDSADLYPDDILCCWE